MENKIMFETVIKVEYSKSSQKRAIKSKRVPEFKEGTHFECKSFIDPETSLPSGSFTIVCGDNGAGKTSLIRLIDPLYPGSYGCRVKYFLSESGEELDYFADYNKICRSCIAVYSSLKENHLNGMLNVKETLEILDYIDLDYDKQYLLSLLEEFNLNSKVPLKKLSHGEQIMVALFIALSRKPKVLLLDEVFSFLSLINRQKIAKILSAYNDTPGKKSIVITSNHPEEDSRNLQVDFYLLLDHFELVEMLHFDDLASKMHSVSDSICDAITQYRELMNEEIKGGKTYAGSV